MSERATGVEQVGEKTVQLHDSNTGTGGGVPTSVHGRSVVGLHIDASAAFTAEPQVKMRVSANWKTVGARAPDGTYTASITDADLAYEVSVFGFEQFRLNVSANSGTLSAWAGLST